MDLPVEIVEAILDNVDERKNLSACASVSKDWRALGQSRLYQTISLRNAHKFAPLLDILQTSHTIASIIRRIEIDFVPPVTWANNKFMTNIASDILRTLVHPTTLILRGPRTSQRAHWTHLSYKLRTAIIDVIQKPSLQELEIDGWVFDIPVHDYLRNFLSSPYLRRLRLDHAFSGLYSAGTPPEEAFKPIVLNLHSLNIHVDSHLDTNPKVQEDFNQLLHINPSSKMSLTVGLNTALVAFGNLKDFFTGSVVAGSVDKLELIAGFRNNTIWNLSSYSRMTDLTINACAVTAPSAIPFVQDTLSTLTSDKNNLQSLSFKFCFYSLPEKQWSHLLSFLTSGPFPSLKRVNFDVTTNIPAREDQFGLGMLREHGYEASVTFCSQLNVES